MTANKVDTAKHDDCDNGDHDHDDDDDDREEHEQAQEVRAKSALMWFDTFNAALAAQEPIGVAATIANTAHGFTPRAYKGPRPVATPT